MQVFLVKVEPLLAISNVPSGHTVDLTPGLWSDWIITCIVADLLRGFDYAAFTLWDGSRMAVVHVASINGVIRLLISGSRCMEPYASVTIYCVTVVRLQSHVVVAACKGKLTWFHCRGRWVALSSSILLFINSANPPVFKINRLGSRSFIVEVSLGLRLFHVVGCIDSLFLLGVFDVNVEDLFVVLHSSLFLALSNKSVNHLLIW